MTLEELENQTREFFQRLRASCKNEIDLGKAIDKAIDFYFQNKSKVSLQAELDF